MQMLQSLKPNYAKSFNCIIFANIEINVNLLMEKTNWFRNNLMLNLKVNIANSFLIKIIVTMAQGANLFMNNEVFNKFSLTHFTKGN